MKSFFPALHRIAVPFLILFFAAAVVAKGVPSSMEKNFADPPREAGVRCWWWWLNGNVTKEAITKDLEAMHAKGFSGAMLFDAGGAEQRGNRQVPAGPTFGSPEWVELYLHALKEARRLGLEMGLSIQSGWNLGGPNVTPEFAAKQLTWSEVQIEGPAEYKDKLPDPSRRDNYYRDLCVLAWPTKETCTLKASSQQAPHPADKAIDGDPETFWASEGTQPDEGPTAESPEWLEFSFERPVTVAALRIEGRRGYGPKNCKVIADAKQETKPYELEDGGGEIRFDPITSKVFRLYFEDAFDPSHPDRPRNVQVADVAFLDPRGRLLAEVASRRPIKNLRLKAGYDEIGMSAPDTRFLLNDVPATPGEEDLKLADLQNLTDKLDAEGTLAWKVPTGRWTVLRVGYTTTNARVSTSSAGWKGHVIDYLSRDAFDRYWREVVDPLLRAAGPLVGTVLKQLETDSWECGGMNWSPGFAADFQHYRGYDPIPWLPVVAGRIVESRDASNAFLADLRKTLADCVSDHHYKVFDEYAARYGLEIQPESAGPHAGPLDGIKNYSHSDIVMSEFWAPSPHRPTPPQRFFVKQAASAAHIYGKRLVAAESFTTIGPHWNDVLWKSQKPSMDHEFCSGLNLIFFHTFTCSPREMGRPGQEYFAGTHVNPQVTWWEYSDAFMDYINRIQFMVQQGRFVADVLYYYGDHVPNIFPLKESDPAGVLPGYDYDVTNEDVLLKLKVEDGKIVVPGGISYRLLVLPDHKVLSLAALEKVADLLGQGATVAGPRPERLVSLVGGQAAQSRFQQLTDQLWGEVAGAAGVRQIKKGRLIWGSPAREILQKDNIAPDFEAVGAAKDAEIDYIHYQVGDAEVYFICNQTPSPQSMDCIFRVSGLQPHLWDPLNGEIRPACAFRPVGGRTIVPMRFEPYGSWFVVFQRPAAKETPAADSNFPDLVTIQTLDGPWQVAFEPAWGGPESIRFDQLTDWTQHAQEGIRFYSGKAVYSRTFEPVRPGKGKRCWLDLNRVEDVGIAAVRLNGKDMGIVWTPPFRVEVTEALRPGENQLEVTVVNSWRNRLIGDRDKPRDQRLTNTNINVRDDWTLSPSGLLGPVELKSEQ